MSQATKEQVTNKQISENLIPETINDVSINTNSKSKITTLFPELEVAPLKLNTDNMHTKHEEPTSKSKKYENHLNDTDIDELNYWNDLSGQISEFRHNLRGWPASGGKGYPYIHFPDLLDKWNLSKEEAHDICQVYHLRDPRGKWADDVLKYGLLLTHQYEGRIITWGLDRWYNHEILTPHGHQFFAEFFAIAKIWQYSVSNKT